MSFKPPTSDEIRLAMGLLSSPQYETYFYARLENPHWISPLAKAGAFLQAPGPRTEPGGHTSFPAWPAARYLIRMAAIEPGKVSEAVASIQTTNPSVVRDIVDMAAAMPVQFADRLLPVIEQAVRDGTLWMAQDEAAGICLKLANAGESQRAVEYARTLFGTLPRVDQKDLEHRDAHWYLEGLRTVAPVLAIKAPSVFLPMLCKWTAAAIRRTKKPTDAQGDGSVLWRPAIEDHEQNRDWDWVSSVVGITRDAFDAAIGDQSSTFVSGLKMLEAEKFRVFHRLRLYLINRWEELDPALARDTMLDEKLMDAWWAKHEYAVLVSDRFHRLSPTDQDEWLSRVDRGPDEDEYARRFHASRGRAATADELESRKKWWRFERLHWIRKWLKGEQKGEYECLVREYGEPDLADLHVRTRSGWGPTPPVESDHFDSKTFPEVIKAIVEWSNSGAERPHSLYAGLAGLFGTYLRKRPDRFSGDALLLTRCQPTFVSTFLSSVAEAAKTGTDIKARAVLDLCAWILQQPQPVESLGEGDESTPFFDRDWAHSRDQIAEFIKSICTLTKSAECRYSPQELQESVAALLAILCRGTTNSNLSLSDDGGDPRCREFLSAAINSPRGRSVEAAIEYARWRAAAQGDLKGREVWFANGFKDIPELLEIIEWQLDPANQSVLASAILGSKMPSLYLIDRGWLTANAYRVCPLPSMPNVGTIELWAAWNSFLVWVHAHREYYRILHHQFRSAVEHVLSLREVPKDSDRSPVSQLAVHLVALFGRGDLTLDADGGMVRRIVLEANQRIRIHAIEFVGESLRHPGEVPVEVIERFQQLWDIYWSGPGKDDARDHPTRFTFGAWFSTGRFSVRWALDALLEFAKVVKVPEPDHLVAEELAKVAGQHPLVANQILECIVQGDREAWHLHSIRKHARSILHAGLRAGDEAGALAESLVHELGRRGFVELGSLLDGSPSRPEGTP